jgi:hypothetical protein
MATDHSDHSDIGFTLGKVFSLWLVSRITLDYHEVAGNILVTLSILYLGWKWWRDYKKEKLNKS